MLYSLSRVFDLCVGSHCRPNSELLTLSKGLRCRTECDSALDLVLLQVSTLR